MRAMVFFFSSANNRASSSYAFLEWMMVWLSKQPAWSMYFSALVEKIAEQASYLGKARHVQISTNSLAKNVAIQLDDEDEASERFKSSRRLAYLPSLSTTYTLWYKRRRITITRVQSQTGYYGSKEQTLYVRCVSLSSPALVPTINARVAS